LSVGSCIDPIRSCHRPAVQAAAESSDLRDEPAAVRRCRRGV